MFISTDNPAGKAVDSHEIEWNETGLQITSDGKVVNVALASLTWCAI
jgi:hypothetical protein